MKFKLEVIGFNIEGCMIAEAASAHRIELCDSPADGGTTPSYGFLKMAREKISIELYPIIRPRGGDFFYSKSEFEIMKKDLLLCKSLGCDGIVTGMLLADGTVDKPRCIQLVELAYPLGVTFHRAFDRTVDPYKALDDIIECGFERILTSGHKQAAQDGIDELATLVEMADDKIIIMPGSGVRSANIADIAKRTKAVEFHTSARIFTDSKMKFTNTELDEQLKNISVDQEELNKIVEILEAL